MFDNSSFDVASGPAQASAPPQGHRLLDLMYDGFYLLFLLRGKQPPLDNVAFRERIKEFLDDVEREAVRLGCSAEDVHLCKYAFCATVDEIILTSQFKIREVWLSRPLQLQFFGEALAGEQFFVKLEALRREGKGRLQVLEVFHMCLLLGFQGKYRSAGGEETLNYLTKSLGNEILHWKGARTLFAPHWAAPNEVGHRLRYDVPLWVVGSVFAVLALLALMGLRWQLARESQQALGAYQDVVRPVPQAAHVMITLP